MKRTFWTRNLFISVLMGLVMVLGIQESADALTSLKKVSGDLATELVTPNDFDIRFSLTLKGNTHIEHEGKRITQVWESSDTPAPPSGLTPAKTDQYYIDSSG